MVPAYMKIWLLRRFKFLNLDQDMAHSKIRDPYYCQNSHFSKVKRKCVYPCQNITKRNIKGIIKDVVRNIIISPLFHFSLFQSPLTILCNLISSKIMFSQQQLGESILYFKLQQIRYILIGRLIFAKLSSSSSPSPVELSTALILIISTHPHPTTPTPGIVVMRHFQTSQEGEIWYESSIQPTR